MDLMSFGGHTRRDSQPCGAAVESNVVDSFKNVWVSPGHYEQISARFSDFREQSPWRRLSTSDTILYSLPSPWGQTISVPPTRPGINLGGFPSPKPLI